MAPEKQARQSAVSQDPRAGRSAESNPAKERSPSSERGSHPNHGGDRPRSRPRGVDEPDPGGGAEPAPPERGGRPRPHPVSRLPHPRLPSWRARPAPPG